MTLQCPSIPGGQGPGRDSGDFSAQMRITTIYSHVFGSVTHCTLNLALLKFSELM